MNEMLKKGFLRFMVVAMMVLVLPLTTYAGTQKGTAKVWAGMPLIGHVYVCTPYTLTYSGSGSAKRLTKNPKTGNSYTSAGIALVAYSHYDSWGKKDSPTSFSIYSRGHCDAVFKGCPISMGLQTFKYTGRI